MQTSVSSGVRQLSPMEIVITMVLHAASQNAVAARVMAVLFAIACAIVAPLEWRYDMLPTLEWLQTHGVAIQATMTAAYGQAIGASLLLIAPMIIKSVTARWAHVFALLGTLFAAAELLDVVTNWDAAWQLYGTLAPQWNAQPPGGLLWLVYWLFFLVVLIVTTSVFQIILTACAACFVVCVYNSFASRLVRLGAVAAVIAVAVALFGQVLTLPVQP